MSRQMHTLMEYRLTRTQMWILNICLSLTSLARSLTANLSLSFISSCLEADLAIRMAKSETEIRTIRMAVFSHIGCLRFCEALCIDSCYSHLQSLSKLFSKCGKCAMSMSHYIHSPSHRRGTMFIQCIYRNGRAILSMHMIWSRHWP